MSEQKYPKILQEFKQNKTVTSKHRFLRQKNQQIILENSGEPYTVTAIENCKYHNKDNVHITVFYLFTDWSVTDSPLFKFHMEQVEEEIHRLYSNKTFEPAYFTLENHRSVDLVHYHVAETDHRQMKLDF